MWLDQEGVVRVIPMDDPGRLLGDRARSLLTHDSARRTKLREVVDEFFPTLWDLVDAFEWSDEEPRFEGIDPPSEWRIPDSVIESKHADAVLKEHLRSVPIRWRLDVAMAFMLYVTLDAEEAD